MKNLTKGTFVRIRSGEFLLVDSVSQSEENQFIVTYHMGWGIQSMFYTENGKATYPKYDIVSVIKNEEPITVAEDWFNKAVPEPTEANINNQIACDIEEFSEKVECFVPSPENKDVYEAALEGLNCLKQMAYEGALTLGEPVKEAKIALLDGICDSIVTNVGLATLMGFDIQRAMKEVNASNFSKFVDGEPIFNEQKKIMKSKDYFKPNLEPFI